MKNFDPALFLRVAKEFGTPVYVYDAAVIRDRVSRLKAFDLIRYAQKACSNIHILKLMKSMGAAVDAVSLGELERALRAGYDGKGDMAGVVFTADLLDRATLKRVIEVDVPVNAGSPQMLEQVGEAHPGHRVWVRVNPGFGHGHSRKTNTGGESSKHGIWHEHLDDAMRIIDRHKLKLVGLHMHIGSGVEYEHLQTVCDAMVKQIQKLGRDVSSVSAGGGLSIPYRIGGPTIDTDAYFRIWNAARKKVEGIVGHPVHLEIEPGRYLIAESGKMIAEVRAHKDSGANHFVLVDAGFDNLVRPAMYGAWHEISVLKKDGKIGAGPMRPTVVAGPLCESGDVFTQEEGGVVTPRNLPEAVVGDYLVFHDTGAYGAAMASNYNTRTYAPEVMLDGGDVKLIRRRQRIDELLALEEV
jgi:diaminopimelate decarboxylase